MGPPLSMIFATLALGLASVFAALENCDTFDAAKVRSLGAECANMSLSCLHSIPKDALKNMSFLCVDGFKPSLIEKIDKDTITSILKVDSSLTGPAKETAESNLKRKWGSLRSVREVCEKFTDLNLHDIVLGSFDLQCWFSLSDSVLANMTGAQFALLGKDMMGVQIEIMKYLNYERVKMLSKDAINGMTDFQFENMVKPTLLDRIANKKTKKAATRMFVYTHLCKYLQLNLKDLNVNDKFKTHCKEILDMWPELSAVQISLISIGSTLLFLAIVLGIFFVIRHQRRKNSAVLPDVPPPEYDANPVSEETQIENEIPSDDLNIEKEDDRNVGDEVDEDIVDKVE